MSTKTCGDCKFLENIRIAEPPHSFKDTEVGQCMNEKQKQDFPFGYPENGISVQTIMGVCESFKKK